VLCFQAYSQERHNDQLLREEVSRFGQAFVKIQYPGKQALNELSGKVSISSVRDKYAEIFISPLTVGWFITQNFNYEIVENTESKGISTASSVKEAMGWTSYPTYNQYDSIMHSFVSLYPSLCRLDTIGKTNYGKYVLALKISDNPETEEGEPETFYSSTIHGNETGGFILMMRLAEYLLKNYNTDSRVKNLVDNLVIWINPLANPDGTYKNGNTISSPSRYNANGYDLNRNFPDPDVTNVPQKETADMTKFMRKHHFVISANFHSGDEVVNYPWDRWARLHADNDWFYDISRKFADTVHVNSVPGYMTEFDDGITDGYDWYSINGGRQDFVTYELHGREVTIELDFNFVTPTTSLDALWQYNWRSLLGYLENALYGIHGKVTDDSNGNPVKAMIYINGHDSDSSQVFSDSLNGNFTRLIAPGIWTLKVSAKGYYSTTVSNVAVVNGMPVNLDIKLLPILNAVDTITTPVIKIYPDPASEFIRIIFPERQIGKVKIKVFNSLGEEMADYTDFAYEDTPLVFNIRGLASGWYSVMIINDISGIVDRGRFVIVRSL
ncbi:MAG TPA: M14 family zinc carboxypeptidase, partial [Bacteroidales bacterium]|nr:M14 family zinc carboxypeptidase [Bacteroidales bacterium]